MVDVVRLSVLVLAAVGIGCAGGSSSPAPAGVPSGSAPAAEAEAEAEPEAEAESEAEAVHRSGPAGAGASGAEPEPEPVKFPDGSTAVPCAEAPEKMSCIPGGSFLRGTDDEPENARPSATVWVHTFYMDQYEVTYAEYKACQKAKKCPKARPRYTDFDHPNMPMQGVSWFDAKAYCEAQGKQLPTEAQWEKAARGPDGNIYPWGNEPVTCDRAIYKDARGRSCGLKKAISKPETGRPWDVGSRPAGVYGLFDMVGNSWEWVADWYSRSYEKCGDKCEGIDPRGPCDGAETCAGYNFKIVRGGSWYWDASRQTGVFRRPHFPSNDPFHHFGFRCAATVEQAAQLVNGVAKTKKAAPE